MAKKGCWIIKNVEREVYHYYDEPLYWSNEMGWVDEDSADKFTDAQKKRGNPPMGGKYVKCSKGGK